MKTMRRTAERYSEVPRRGVAAVEFSLIAPVFLALVLGTIEGGTAFETANLMSSAVREGGRLAAMDWEGVVPDGMSANEKVLMDIRNFLTAAGMPGDEMQLSITHAESASAGSAFDLGDPDNRLKLFRISVEVPYEAVSNFPSTFMQGQTVTASLVFRAGRVSFGN